VKDERQGKEALADVLRAEASKVRAVFFVPEHGRKKKILISKELTKKVRSKSSFGSTGIRWTRVQDRARRARRPWPCTHPACHLRARHWWSDGAHRLPTMSDDMVIEAFLAGLHCAQRCHDCPCDRQCLGFVKDAIVFNFTSTVEDCELRRKAWATEGCATRCERR
jgi:hypothetical protein